MKPPRAAIRDRATFIVGGWMLLVLLAGLFALEPLGVPVSAVAAACAALLLAVAGRGRVISTRRVLREAAPSTAPPRRPRPTSSKSARA